MLFRSRSVELVTHVVSVASATDLPLNVLALRGGPTVAELASVGVRRVSTGGSLAAAAYGALVAGARELLADGTSGYAEQGISRGALKAAFAAGTGP